MYVMPNCNYLGCLCKIPQGILLVHVGAVCTVNEHILPRDF